MGKKDSKHSHKKKSSHKKKHKKEKKKHKEKKSKHYKKSSESSDSDVSTDSSSDEYESKKKTEERVDVEKKSIFEDESGWNNLFSDKYTISKEKTEPKKNRCILDKPGCSDRELNPYWKDGGTGLPPAKETSSSSEKKHDRNNLRDILEKAKNISNLTGTPLERVVQDEWGGPLNKLIHQIENAGDKNSETSQKTAFQCASSPLSARYSEEAKTENPSKQLKFMKPGDFSNYDFKNSYSRNWKKKEDGPIREHVTEDQNPRKTVEEVTKTKTVATPDELNALAAKAIKADIMGNKALAEKLRKEVEVLKKEREEYLATGGKAREHRKEEVILLTQTNQKGLSKPCESSAYSSGQGSKKRQRFETHKGNERLRYFMNDDKHSLKSMFENEKFGTAEQNDEVFLKLAKRGKLQSDEDLDDDFLDRVRCSDYERKESEKQRTRTMNEAKSQHKSLSTCRWCLDGNNIRKHLVVSVGSKCYLCLPSDKSLTNGHCLIVPIHHDTCGTLLDEDVWDEMQLYRKNLCKMFEDSGQDVVFFENARSFNRFPHMILNCVPMEKEIGDLAPIYFKKAILESEAEWSNNKKLIDMRNKDVRRSVPKGLPYFAVEFGMDGGFAHVIEDEKLFPSNFAEEIIGGMLDLDAVNWRKRRKESFEGQKEKVEEFIKKWKKYDTLHYMKNEKPISESSSSD